MSYLEGFVEIEIHLQRQQNVFICCRDSCTEFLKIGVKNWLVSAKVAN